MKEFLPTLNQRTKWYLKTNNFPVGDIFFIVDDKEPRGVWQKGIVESVYPGNDNQVRVVDIKTNHGILRRPVGKLCLFKPFEGIKTAS